MNILLIGFVLTLSYKFQVENGQVILESGPYTPVYDTVSGGGDDVSWEYVKERDAYICGTKDGVESVVKNAWFVQGRDTSKVEVIGLYNLDSGQNNVQYVRHRKIGKTEFLFARLGPKTCPYFVAWKREGRIYKRKDIFQPVIEFDPYKDEKYLDDWLKSLFK